VWHTHILSSIQLYNRDCVAICGHKFFHDDSLGGGDRTPGAELDRAFEATEKLWRRQYGENEPYKCDGTLYRGEPPPHFYNFATWSPTACGAAPKDRSSTPRRSTVEAAGGATSTGRKRPTDQQEWPSLSSDATSSTGEPFFIPAVPARWNRFDFDRHKNPPRPGYAFGRHASHGWGYYALETKEGWEVTYHRLLVKEAKALSILNTFYCTTCCCATFGRLSPNQLAEMDKLQAKLSDVRGQMDDVKRILADKGSPTSLSTSSTGSSSYDTAYPLHSILLASACGGSVLYVVSAVRCIFATCVILTDLVAVPRSLSQCSQCFRRRRLRWGASWWWMWRRRRVWRWRMRWGVWRRMRRWMMSEGGCQLLQEQVNYNMFHFGCCTRQVLV
jgi:hypothetical protein